MTTTRLGNRQLQALRFVAKHDGKQFSIAGRSPSQARAFDTRLERLEELGLITGLKRMGYYTSFDELMSGTLFGYPHAWIASMTPEGRALLDTGKELTCTTTSFTPSPLRPKAGEDSTSSTSTRKE